MSSTSLWEADPFADANEKIVILSLPLERFESGLWHIMHRRGDPSSQTIEVSQTFPETGLERMLIVGVRLLSRKFIWMLSLVWTTT